MQVGTFICRQSASHLHLHKEETAENNMQRKESQGKRNMNEWNTTGGEGVFYIVNHARPKGTPGQEGLFPGTAYY